MGNDGGSIPKRSELVREKAKEQILDKDIKNRAQWLFCALSKKPLRRPVASCPLGKLYNKEAIVEYLIDKSLYGDGDKICGHIKSLKHLKTLDLTPNPAYNDDARPTSSTSANTGPAPFVCPLSGREMNGRSRFVYLDSCGHAFSEAALKEIKEDSCPQCAIYYNSENMVVIYPNIEELPAIKSAMETKFAASKKESKRKRINDEDSSTRIDKKKANSDSSAIQTGRGTLQTTSVIASIARTVNKELESKTLHRSLAIQELYEPKLPLQKERNLTSSRY